MRLSALLAASPACSAVFVLSCAAGAAASVTEDGSPAAMLTLPARPLTKSIGVIGPTPEFTVPALHPVCPRAAEGKKKLSPRRMLSIAGFTAFTPRAK